MWKLNDGIVGSSSLECGNSFTTSDEYYTSKKFAEEGNEALFVCIGTAGTAAEGAVKKSKLTN